MPAALTPPPAFAPLRDTKLFAPWQLGRLALSHRIVMAPLTRMRGEEAGHGVYVPADRHVTYYRQRASSGGLLLTEAVDIAHNASAYPGVAGVFTPAQLAAWKRVTDAVHAAGGSIFVQLWHTGRASGPAMRAGQQPVSSSVHPMSGSYLDGADCAANPPRPLTVDEIHDLTREWAAAAKRAVDEAGFDGVEIHGANGYLLEQFLHDNINDRTDAYGGSVENRCRFVLEVVQAVADAIGADRTGLRLSPFNYFQDTRDSNPNAHWAYLCQQLAGLAAAQRPVYVHMIEPRFDEVLDEQKKLEALAAYTSSADAAVADAAAAAAPKALNSLDPFRRILDAAGIRFLAAGGYTRDNAAAQVASGHTDAVVFGRLFIANPDLVARLRNGWPLNAYDRSTFYGASSPDKGYVDYPFYEPAAADTADAAETPSTAAQPEAVKA